jgi:DNA-binding CsgD family transcriptional regulator
MARRLDELSERLARADDLRALNDSVLALRDHFEVEHAVYHVVRGDGVPWAALTYAPAWVDAYVEAGCQAIDPVVRACFTRTAAVDWKTLDWSPRPARALLSEALAHGLGDQGLSLPIHGPGGRFALFTLNHRRGDAGWARFSAAHASDVRLTAHLLNERAVAIEGGDAASRARGLSPRETDAPTLLAAGQSRASAADSLGVSEHTLRTSIESARNRLGARNTTHAVASALARGLIGL